MIVERFKQYSKEWWNARLGIPSASLFSKLVTSTGKKSSSWKEIAFKLSAEIERKKPDETFQSDAMKRGLELEPEARLSYEFITQKKSEEVGLIYQDGKKLWSCSPDGLYEKNGLEIKCLSAGNHIRVRYENEIPAKFKPQVYGSLWICDDLDYWDFFCYHPEMKPALITTTRDDEQYLEYAAALENYLPEMVEFIHEVAGL